MGEDECSAGDVAGLAGAGGDVPQDAPAAGEQGEPASAGGAAFGPAHGVANSAIPLPFAAAAGLLVGVAILISLVAARTTVQRDIS
jgi:hypothetical protein